MESELHINPGMGILRQIASTKKGWWWWRRKDNSGPSPNKFTLIPTVFSLVSRAPPSQPQFVFFSSVCLYASVPTFIKLTHRILKLFPSPPNVPNNISISLSVGKKSSVLSHHLSSFSGVGVVMAMVVSAHGWTVNYSQKVSKKNKFVSLCILVIIQNLFKKDDNWFFKQNHFFSSCFS